jgi:hypothetical protein
VIEVGLVTGYLIAWALRKVRRVGKSLDDDVDMVLDSGLDRLHAVVAGKLTGDPALTTLMVETADSGTVSDRTRRRVEDAIAEAVAQDTSFADMLAEALAEVQRHSPSGSVTASGDRVAAAGGNVSIRADHGSAAAQTMGDVTIRTPPPDPSRPGRSSG